MGPSSKEVPVRMLLLVLALCVVAVHGQAQAPTTSIESFGPPFSTFASDGDILCTSWPSATRPAKGFNTALYLAEATKHAWVYGFVVGAGYMSADRLTRVNADTVDAWMDTYCAKHPRATIANAAAVLIDELAEKR